MSAAIYLKSSILEVFLDRQEFTKGAFVLGFGLKFYNLLAKILIH